MPPAARPVITDAVVVGRILREYHLRSGQPPQIRRLHGSVHGSSVAYRMTAVGEPPWEVRAFRAEAPVPAQFSGTAAETMTDWVVGRARTLARLEEVGYPAPRPVRARSGELVGVAGPWLTWATTFIDGPVLRPSLDQLRMLGQALGRLHAAVPGGGSVGSSRAGGPGESGGSGGSGEVHDSGDSGEAGGVHGVGGAGGSGPGKAAWHPDAAIATTLTRLDAVAALVPPGWRPMHEAFRRTARAVQRAAGQGGAGQGGAGQGAVGQGAVGQGAVGQGAVGQGGAGQLPAGLVHGDAWPGSAVQDAAGQVILIDWDAAGRGLPVLDIGYCLAECHLDSGLPPDRPEAWLIQPDEQRIAAVAGGYGAARILTPAERELLADAVRFGAAFVGALHFEAALTGGASGPAMDARLSRLRNRLAVSDTVAELALQHL